MEVNEKATSLAGFALAHALWSVSDLPDGASLVPLAFVDRDGEHTLSRFEGESQEEAIGQGRAFVAERRADSNAWAFAHEGQARSSDGGLVDVIAVESWSEGMGESVTFVQPFQPFARGAFRVLGPALPVVGGKIISEEDSEPYLRVLYAGVSGHDHAAALWDKWLQEYE